MWLICVSICLIISWILIKQDKNQYKTRRDNLGNSCNLKQNAASLEISYSKHFKNKPKNMFPFHSIWGRKRRKKNFFQLNKNVNYKPYTISN